MKRLIITTILLTAVMAIQAQWSQKIVEKKTETGKTSVSMIHYEDSIGYLIKVFPDICIEAAS